MAKKKYKSKQFLELLQSTPNVSAVCQDIGLSRNTVYRWCSEDPDFKTAMNKALKLGVDSINDLAENRLVTHVENGNLRAIQYWLDNHKKEYIKPRPKVEPQPFSPVTKIEIVPPKNHTAKVSKSKNKSSK